MDVQFTHQTGNVIMNVAPASAPASAVVVSTFNSPPCACLNHRLARMDGLHGFCFHNTNLLKVKLLLPKLISKLTSSL
jgi:hypothetical protein